MRRMLRNPEGRCAVRTAARRHDGDRGVRIVGAKGHERGCGAMEARAMSLSDLARSCREETARFLRHEVSRDEYCFELFRRAICDRIQPAWDAVFTQYRGMVLAWVRRHPMASAAHEEDEYWVNRTFDRFWSAVGPERFTAFHSMAAILRYLKLCTHSLLLDEARSRRTIERDAPFEQLTESAETPDVAETAIGQLSGSDLWETISAELQDGAERQVAYLCLVLDMKPREVHDRHPDLYPTVDDVYRTKRNVLDRLRRNPAIRAFLG